MSIFYKNSFILFKAFFSTREFALKILYSMRILSSQKSKRRLLLEHSYEYQMLKHAERIVRTLIRHNMTNPEQVLDLFDRMVDFPLKYHSHQPRPFHRLPGKGRRPLE
jgi:hypothetical protein